MTHDDLLVSSEPPPTGRSESCDGDRADYQ
jgi:hypothetical protein